MVIVFETMWNSTEKMAEKMAQGVRDAGLSVKLFDVAASDPTEVVKEMFDARAFLIGSSTHDNDMLPHIAGFLELVKGFKPKNRIAGAFGSYGWGGGATAEIEKALKDSGIEVIMPAMGVKYVPDADEEKKCYEYGLEFGKRARPGHIS